jgi:hypothetical protein
MTKREKLERRVLATARAVYDDVVVFSRTWTPAEKQLFIAVSALDWHNLEVRQAKRKASK